MIQSKILKSLHNVKHGFFTKDMFKSSNRNWFNTEGDVNDSFNKQFNSLLNVIDRNVNDFILLNQIHSNEVLLVQNVTKAEKYDASVTKVPKLVLGIRTADCVPVLLVDSKNRVIAAAHAGWRGALSGIIENTISKMISSGAEVENIIAAIGPCIKQKSYEVDFEFYNKFTDQDPNNMKFFINSSRNNHFMFDLSSYVKNKLNENGVSIIDDCDIDTFTDERCFSYRKYSKNLAEMGSILSVISIDH